MNRATLATGEQRAWGWLAALRAGDTTPWHAWTAPGSRSDRFLPGAQQLELLRRLNLAGRPDPVLVERVVTASAPGRGRPDLELDGAAAPSRFGPRPVDPADLPDAELLRVATGLLAEDLVAVGTPTAPPSVWRRPWARSYRLVGSPWLADPLREALTRRGRPPGGRTATVVVLGADVESMLRHAWTARSFSEGGPGWEDWLALAVGHDRLPPRADLVAMAGRWASRVGSGRVRVVLDDRRLPRVLGVRGPLPSVPVVSASGIDLARRTAAPLGLLVVPERRAALLRETLLPRVAASAPAPGETLGIPSGRAPWVRGQAERVHRQLARAGYPVVGSLDRLHEASTDGVVPDDGATLALAVRLLLEGGSARRAQRRSDE